MGRTTVYLADLRYTYMGIMSSDAMPLGVAYMKAVMDRDLQEVHSEIFAYPERLEEAIRERPPEVLFLTNYMWNLHLSLLFARWLKSIRPEALVVMGGPNFPIEEDRRADWFSGIPEIDLYATGEGDFYAAEIVQMFQESGKSIGALLNKAPHSSMYRLDGTVVNTPIQPRTKALDAIPSPWLTGVLDKYFDGKMAPLFETNRGCPFTCTFCVQGTRWYTKVNYFSVERLREELHYIGRKINEHCPEQKVLRIADPNFGMFERDIEISSYIGEIQAKYNYPLYIDATTGKNQAENIIRSIEKVNGALVMYQAVQSLDEDVLLNIKRKNIKLDTYEEVQVYVKGRGLRTSSDLILGLPAETLDSHLSAVKKLINSGTNNLNNFQSMLLMGSEMETMEQREAYQFETRFRIIPKNFGEYLGQKVFETDEIVVASSTLSFEEYLIARKYHFIISVFWNESRFQRLVTYLMDQGLPRWDFIQAIYDHLYKGNTPFDPIMRSFLDETRSELFPTREAAIAYYSQPDQFERACRSEIGDNLMYKYRGMASFWAWDAACRTVFAAVRQLMAHTRPALPADPAWNRFLDDWETYAIMNHSYGQCEEEVLKDRRATFQYDIASWMDDSTTDYQKFRYASPTVLRFYVTEEHKELLRGAFKVWNYTMGSLPMIVKRIHNSWQVRKSQVVEHAVPCAS